MPDNKRGTNTTLVPSGRPLQIPEENDLGRITVHDLNNILQANQKALTIYLEVENQNEKILEILEEENTKLDKVNELENQIKDLSSEQSDIQKTLKDNLDLTKEMKKKLEDVDKNMFKLVLILGGAGIGTVLTIIQTLFSHK